jgi:branched-chain amino acid transport system permease protein
MVVVFGSGSVWGALLGAAGITVLVQVLTQVGTQPGMPKYMPALLSYAAYGVTLVLIMAFLPAGILPALSALKDAAARRFAARRGPAVPSRQDLPPPATEPAGRTSHTSP